MSVVQYCEAITRVRDNIPKVSQTAAKVAIDGTEVIPMSRRQLDELSWSRSGSAFEAVVMHRNSGTHRSAE